MRRALLLLVLAGCTNQVVVPMLAENNSGQKGTATFEETQQGLKVVVKVTAIDDPRAQNVHFHMGQCGEISAKVLTLKPNPTTDDHELGLLPLSPDGAGMAISDNLLRGVTYATVGDGGWVVNVHDPRDPTLYTSCGNIR
jgi:hypothetical protein